jgi:hypothetical protein
MSPNQKTKNEENQKNVLDDLNTQWQKDLEELQKNLKTTNHDLTHTTVEIKKEGQEDPVRKTEIDLISGGIVITLAKDSNLSEEEINQINEKAIQMAREELQKKMEQLSLIIQKLIEVLGGMVTPGSAVAQGLKILEAFVPAKPAVNPSSKPT